MAASFRVSCAALAAFSAALTVAAPLHAAGVEATPPSGQTEEEEDAPTPAPLTVGSMAIASDINLSIEAMAVDVTADRVTYSYRLRNKGSAKLALAASVALPDLEVNSEGNNVYNLPTQSPENPVNLVVKANDQPVPTMPYLQATALGIDRQAEIKAAGLPLIPFGPPIEKALAAAKPDVLNKLASLGLVTPHDPSQPDTPVIADWSLRVIHGWTATLDPNGVTNLSVAFTPVKAVYKVGATSLVGLDALKEQVCLTPAVMTAARTLLKGKDSQVEVEDITLANDGPARWLDNPVASVAVRKPQPNSVISFCGLDPASFAKPVVTGKMPGSGEAAGLRVLIFSAAAP